MKYRNALDVLPDELLREVQKYASGDVLYIPTAGKRQKWGSESGAKIYYEERNDEIRRLYKSGDSLESLSDTYGLTIETIKKIVYCN